MTSENFKTLHEECIQMQPRYLYLKKGLDIGRKMCNNVIGYIAWRRLGTLSQAHNEGVGFRKRRPSDKPSSDKECGLSGCDQFARQEPKDVSPWVMGERSKQALSVDFAMLRAENVSRIYSLKCKFAK